MLLMLAASCKTIEPVTTILPVLSDIPFVTIKEEVEAKEPQWLWEWVSSWDTLSSKIYALEGKEPPELIFFDEEYVYTTSDHTAPAGEHISGPPLYGDTLQWKKQAHNNKIVLPDGSTTVLDLEYQVAATPNGNYVVMPAPSYWGDKIPDNPTATSRQVLNGIFVQTISQSPILRNYTKKMEGYETRENFIYKVNDDIVQNYFKSDKKYQDLHTQEVKSLYGLLNIQNKPKLRAATKIWLEQYHRRQMTYLQSISPQLPELEDLILTKQGWAQYAKMNYFKYLAGAGFGQEMALDATLHDDHSWSSIEGLGLVMIYNQLTDQINWSELWGVNSKTIITLLEEELEKAT